MTESDFEPPIPTDIAERVAEGVRALNHLTIGPLEPGRPGWEYPSDVYRVVTELALAADRLPQAFEQLARHLTRPADGTRYKADADTTDSAAELVAATAASLAAAGRLAEQLADQLRVAQSATSHLASGPDHLRPVPDGDHDPT